MCDRRIDKLAQVFNELGIYSKNRFNPKTPLRIFQKEFPNQAYSSQVETFLESQMKISDGLGADLPWWGNMYFDKRDGIRIMILTKESINPNGGSVVAYMPILVEQDRTKEDLKDYRKQYGWQRFDAWSNFRKLFNRCLMDYNLTYITDAKKMEGEGWKTLLEQEIQEVQPDVILCLGDTGLKYFTDINITEIVDRADTSIAVSDDKLPLLKPKPIVVVSLFPSNTNKKHYTSQREGNVVNTFCRVIEKLNNKGER